MTKIEVESFSAAVNAAIIRLPGRKFPGIVIQGDSLKILAGLAGEIDRLSATSKNQEMRDAISELHQILDRYIKTYEEAFRVNNEPLPYS